MKKASEQPYVLSYTKGLKFDDVVKNQERFSNENYADFYRNNAISEMDWKVLNRLNRLSSDSATVSLSQVVKSIGAEADLVLKDIEKLIYEGVLDINLDPENRNSLENVTIKLTENGKKIVSAYQVLKDSVSKFKNERRIYKNDKLIK